MTEPDVLPDVDDVEARVHLLFAHLREKLRRTGPRVFGAVLATRRGDHDDPAAGLADLGHQAGGHVGLVIGMRPDAEQCADAGWSDQGVDGHDGFLSGQSGQGRRDDQVRRSTDPDRDQHGPATEGDCQPGRD